MICRIDANKTFSITQSANIYSGESKSELIQVLIPTDLCPVDLNQCKLILYYKNSQNQGNANYLHLSSESYKDYLVAETYIDANMTSVSGQLEIWVEIKNIEIDFLFKTSSAKLTIKQSSQFSSSLSQAQLSLLDDWEKRMNTLENECRSVLNQSIKYCNLSKKILERIIKGARLMYSKIKEKGDEM